MSHGASHAGDGLGSFPRVCSGCGGRVVLGGERALWFETTVVERKQEQRSYHSDCYPRA